MKNFYFMIVNLICNMGCLFPIYNWKKSMQINDQEVLLTLFLESIKKKKEKEILELMKINKKLFERFQQKKEFIKKPVKKNIFCCLLIVFFLIIVFFCFFFFYEENKIDIQINDDQIFTINKKTLKKKEKELVWGQEFLIAEIDGVFTLLKKSREVSSFKNQYSEEKNNLFNFLFSKHMFFRKFLYKSITILFYKQDRFTSNRRTMNYRLIPIEWEKIQNQSKGRCFFSKKYIVIYNNQLNLIDCHNICEEMPGVPEFFHDDLDDLRDFFYKISLENFRFGTKETATSVINKIIKKCPQIDQIQNCIEYGIDYKNYFEYWIFLYDGKKKEILRRTHLSVLAFLFSEPVFKNMYIKQFSETIILKKIVTIKRKVYEEIKNLGKNYCLFRPESFLFFFEGYFQIVYLSLIEQEKTRYKIQNLNPFIKQKNEFEKFLNDCFEEKEKRIKKNLEKFKKITDQKTFIEEWLKIYQRRKDIKGVLYKDFLYILNDYNFSVEESFLGSFLESFFLQIKNKNKEIKINTEGYNILYQENNEPAVFLLPNYEIISLSEKLENCFFLYQDEKGKYYQESSGIFSFEEKFYSYLGEEKRVKKQEFWNFLIQLQESKTVNNLFQIEKKEKITLQELETIIPEFVLQDFNKLKLDFLSYIR